MTKTKIVHENARYTVIQRAIEGGVIYDLLDKKNGTTQGSYTYDKKEAISHADYYAAN